MLTVVRGIDGDAKLYVRPWTDGQKPKTRSDTSRYEAHCYRDNKTPNKDDEPARILEDAGSRPGGRYEVHLKPSAVPDNRES